MYENELKRIIKSNKSILFISLAIIAAIFCSYQAINNARTSIFDSKGEERVITGAEAIRLDNQRWSALKGDLTEDKIMIVLNKYRDSFSKDNSSDDIINYIPVVCMFESISSDKGYKNGNLPDTVAKAFYENRNKKQYEILIKNSFNKDEIDYFDKLESKVKKPFYYSPNAGWANALNNLAMLYSILCVISLLYAAPSFSNAYKNGADEVIRTTEFGRKKFAKAKILSTTLFVLTISVIATVVYLLPVARVLEIKGLDSSIQFMALNSPTPMTCGEVLNFVVGFGILSVVSSTVFTMFVSSACKNSISSVSIVFIVLATYVLESFYLKSTVKNAGNNVFKLLMDMTPFAGFNIYYVFLGYEIHSFAGIVTWTPFIIVAASIISVVLFYKLALNIYEKHEC